MTDYEIKYQSWCLEPTLPESMKDELKSIKGDLVEQELRFGQVIPFGTAGMRGLMGAGTNRMNIYTVCRAARGLGTWLLSSGEAKRCAIAYDSRHNSQLFAEICAGALAEQGIEVFLYHMLAPTPMLSFAVRYLKCGCGIVISASHNDGRYNGMKCYGPDGCQMTDEPAALVFEKILDTPLFEKPVPDIKDALNSGLVSYIDNTVWKAYYSAVLSQRVGIEITPENMPKILYTPLNGTGNIPVRHILSELGIEAEIVKVQEEPDGDFTTCPYPNPETDEALKEAYLAAESCHPDLIIGTDPDADRVAVAAATEKGWRKFSGNELGCLLLDFILRHSKISPESEIVRSIVSSPLADRIAAEYGCKAVSVLTGFKYIGGEILRLEQQGKEENFLFGFEESCGYLKGSYARDKDAVVASMLVCELAAWCKANGKTLAMQMDEIYNRYGFYKAGVKSVEMSGLEGPAKIASFVDSLRSDPAVSFCGSRIIRSVDYRSGESMDRSSGAVAPTNLPSSNVYELDLEDLSTVIVRPSGTEPKLKIYYSAVGKTAEAAQDRVDVLNAEMTARLEKI